MKYYVKKWSEHELRSEIAKEKSIIKEIESDVSVYKNQLTKHRERLQYLERLSVNQTKINFDEQD